MMHTLFYPLIFEQQIYSLIFSSKATKVFLSPIFSSLSLFLSLSLSLSHSFFYHCTTNTLLELYCPFLTVHLQIPRVYMTYNYKDVLKSMYLFRKSCEGKYTSKTVNVAKYIRILLSHCVYNFLFIYHSYKICYKTP